MPPSSRTRDDGTVNTFHGGRTIPQSPIPGTSSLIDTSRAPGLKFAFTGQNLAISFGAHTSPGVLIAYRISGLDWQFTNLSASSTHHLILSKALPTQLPLTFELRVTNWAYGVQISSVHVSSNSSIIKVPEFERSIEFIGDSLTAGMYATYEAFSGFGYNIGAGFGNVEFSITAYPGICLHDAACWGNPRGQTYQWFQTSDTSWRAAQLYGQQPEKWDFGKRKAADIVVVNLGTNDNNTANGVRAQDYLESYVELVGKVHRVWPEAQIVLMYATHSSPPSPISPPFTPKLLSPTTCPFLSAPF